MDGKVVKYLRRAREIAQKEGLTTRGSHGGGGDIDPAVLVGIAAMLQLEEMSAPMIVLDNNGQATNLHIDKPKGGAAGAPGKGGSGGNGN